MEYICEEARCYGCGLCADICPAGAIEMRENAETGHFRPFMDQKVCTDCCRCKKLCPANRTPSYFDDTAAYAAWQTDPQKQLGSSSGGVAAALYETAVNNGLTIVGTVQNESLAASLTICTDGSDKERYRGSKYVQADTKGVYKELSAALRAGKQVLFIGTPCQCEAARSAAGKNAENLLTVDLICHGVPSQRLLRDYIAWVGDQTGSTVDALSFRSDWGVEMQMFSGGRRVWTRRMYWDYYLDLFSCGYSVNDACFQCPYACEKRASDLTIGDFWGIGETVPFDDPKRKVSVVGVNTEKGRAFLARCTQLTLAEREWSEAVQGNDQLRCPQKKSPDYDLFWEIYHRKGLDEALRATVFDKVTARYKKEYPKILLKSKAKNAVKKLLGKI